MLTRNILVTCIVLLAATAATLARGGEMVQGEREANGECVQYRIMKYSVTHGGENEETYMRVFERPCGTNCWEEVYDGPASVYAGDYSTTMYDPGLPILIDGGGTGFVTVPVGDGGTFAPSASCDATFTPDASATFVIHSSFLQDIGIE